MSLRICAYGQLGSGKTLSLVEKCLRYYVYTGGEVYSNIPLFKIPYHRVDSAAILFELEKPCFLLMDELWHLANSRKSMSIINDAFNMLLLRSRKKRWFVAFSQQHPHQTDLRIRYVTECWIEPSMRGSMVTERNFNVNGEEGVPTRFDGSLVWDLFESEKDPFTLHVDELRECYVRFCRDHGLTP